MAQKHTQLSAENLIVYPSERMRKTDDGGGLLISEPLTGADNEIFNPTSRLELVNGGFDARLVYPAVLTSDLAKLYGGYLVVGSRPEAENVSILLFKGEHYGEEFAGAKQRIEAYSTPTIESNMTVLGRQTKGSKLVQTYQRIDDELPKVGERYCLQDGQHYNYIRIASLDYRIRTFTDPATGKDFQRRVIALTLTDALRYDFQGINYPSVSYANSESKLLETQIADSSRYYGLRPLAAEALQGSTQITVDAIYERLVPTTTADTAWADQYPAGKACYIPTGAALRLTNNHASWTDKAVTYAPTSILPGSVQITGYTDNGRGTLTDTRGRTIAVDYSAGTLQGFSGYLQNITYTPAARVANSAYTVAIPIDQTNQSTEWSPFLTPKPAPGSVNVSYLSGGQWYEIQDPGNYTLTNHRGEQAGTVSRDGSVMVSLGDLPDAGSKIIVTWSPLDYYYNLDDASTDSVLTPQVLDSAAITIADTEDPRPMVPGTVTVISGGQTARDDGQGKLTGDFTGSVDYAAAAVSSASISGASAQITSERYTGERKIENLMVSNTGSAFMLQCAEKIQRGSLLVGLIVTAIKTVKEDKRMATGQQAYGKEWKFSRALAVQKTLYNTLYSYSSASGAAERAQIYTLTDDKNGNLYLNGQKAEGTILYATGQISFKAEMQEVIAEVSAAEVSLSGSPEFSFSGSIYDRNKKTQTAVYLEASSAIASYVSDAGTIRTTVTLNTGKRTYNALSGKPQPSYAVFNSWRLEGGGKTYYERDGIFYTDFDPLTGNGTAAGTLSADGTITLNADIDTSKLKITAGVYVLAGDAVYRAQGRTPASPVLPQSLTIRARAGGKTVTGIAQADGTIRGELTGTIDYEHGYWRIESKDPIQPESLRYNVTTQAYLPLPQDLIGIDAVRLRPDGKTPIYRAGDTVLIHHRESHNLGSAHTGGNTAGVGRADIDNLAIKDANGKPVLASLYDYDLDAGEITWASPLDLSAYQMPLTAHTSREELNRIVKLQTDGTLTLQNPLARDYPKGTAVSSCLTFGTMQALAADPFEQEAWTRVWSNQRIGDPILAKLNAGDYPIIVTNDGAITGRWLIRFDSPNQFKLYEENLGLLGQYDMLQDLAPINPATGKPYFRIRKEAFGGQGASAWKADNCIRFNTFGTSAPVWVIKTVQPSAAAQTERDQFEICFRGDTQEI